MSKPLPRPGDVVDVHLVSVPQTGSIIVRLLAPPRGIITHWVPGKPRGRSVACPGRLHCLTAIHRQRSTWKGYCPAQLRRDGKPAVWVPCVIEITEFMFSLLKGQDVRGQVWRMERVIMKRNVSRVEGEQIAVSHPELLPPAWSIEPTLAKVYGTSEIELDVDPVIPACLQAAVQPDDFNPLPSRTERSDSMNAEELEAARKRMRRAKDSLGSMPTDSNQP